MPFYTVYALFYCITKASNAQLKVKWAEIPKPDP